jgi:hypothetical protein
MNPANSSRSSLSLRDIDVTQEPSRATQQLGNALPNSSSGQLARNLQGDLIKLQDPGHLLDALQGCDKLCLEHNTRIATVFTVGLSALSTATGVVPASMGVARSYYGKPSPEKASACQSAKASLVGSIIGIVGVGMSIVGYTLGQTHFTGEVRSLDKKLLSRYRQILQAREESGELFPQGRPSPEDIVSRYMKLDKKERKHIRDALESSDTEVATDIATANV